MPFHVAHAALALAGSEKENKEIQLSPGFLLLPLFDCGFFFILNCQIWNKS